METVRTMDEERLRPIDHDGIGELKRSSREVDFAVLVRVCDGTRERSSVGGLVPRNRDFVEPLVVRRPRNLTAVPREAESPDSVSRSLVGATRRSREITGIVDVSASARG